MNKDRVRQILVYHEGLRLQAYDDANGEPVYPGQQIQGHVTIGVGRNLEQNGISINEAYLLLGNDLVRIENALIRALPWLETAEHVQGVRQEVLIQMAFQMGVRGLLGFKKMLNALEKNDIDQACAEMFDSAWARRFIKRSGYLIDAMRRNTYADINTWV